MSWIRDVKEQISVLDMSAGNLRKFSLMVGIVLVLVSAWAVLKEYHPLVRYVPSACGAVLMITGLTAPRALSGVYRVWMGCAFAVGWIVSRVLLIILFFGVVTPVGLIARITGKEFMDINMKKTRDSYWIKKQGKCDYEKMY